MSSSKQDPWQLPSIGVLDCEIIHRLPAHFTELTKNDLRIPRSDIVPCEIHQERCLARTKYCPDEFDHFVRRQIRGFPSTHDTQKSWFVLPVASSSVPIRRGFDSFLFTNVTRYCRQMLVSKKCASSRGPAQINGGIQGVLCK